MTSTQKTLECLDQQMVNDLQTLMKLKDRQAAGESVSREIKELESAIDVKIALAEGLRKQR